MVHKNREVKRKHTAQFVSNLLNQPISG